MPSPPLKCSPLAAQSSHHFQRQSYSEGGLLDNVNSSLVKPHSPVTHAEISSANKDETDGCRSPFIASNKTPLEDVQVMQGDSPGAKGIFYCNSMTKETSEEYFEAVQGKI